MLPVRYLSNPPPCASCSSPPEGLPKSSLWISVSELQVAPSSQTYSAFRRLVLNVISAEHTEHFYAYVRGGSLV